MTVKSVKPCLAVCACVRFYLFFATMSSKILLLHSGDSESQALENLPQLNFAIGT